MPELIGPIVAGIPLVQEIPDGVAFSTAGGDAWTSPSLVAPGVVPVHVRHRFGEARTDGLRLLVDAPPPMGRCFVDPAGNLAMSNEPIFEPRGTQLLTTVEDGREYVLTHSIAPVAGFYQWLWQRTIISYALASRGVGLMAHACGIALPDGRAFLCPGASGTGKSTIGALLSREVPGVAVLSDDRVAVTTDGDVVRAWGTPWHSSAGLATPESGVLDAIVFVRHGPTASVRQMHRREVMPRLLPAVALPFWSESLLAGALDLLGRVVARTPSIEFSYSPDHPDAARTLLDALERLTPGGVGR